MIELIIVVVILGALAATALPKFIYLGTDARIATINQTAGAVQSAADLAYSKCIVVAGCNAAGVGSTIIGPDGATASMWNG